MSARSFSSRHRPRSKITPQKTKEGRLVSETGSDTTSPDLFRHQEAAAGVGRDKMTGWRNQIWADDIQ